MSRTFRLKKPQKVWYYYWVVDPSNNRLSEADAESICRRFFSERSFVTKTNSNVDDRRYAQGKIRVKVKAGKIDSTNELKAFSKKHRYD